MIMRSSSITIRGRTPLLTYDPKTGEAGCYRLLDGSCCVLNSYFSESMHRAERQCNGMPSFLSRCYCIAEEMIPLTYHDGSPIKDYECFVTRTLLKENNFIRTRACFKQWQCQFTIDYDQQHIADPKLIRDVLVYAGTCSGIGCYRPHIGGTFGQYSVISHREI